MDVAQAINATVAIVAIGTSHYAFVRLGRYNRLHIAVHFVQLLLLAWYAVINLALAATLWQPEVRQVVPLFRWAFAPLIATYALRQYMVSRRVETVGPMP